MATTRQSRRYPTSDPTDPASCCGEHCATGVRTTCAALPVVAQGSTNALVADRPGLGTDQLEVHQATGMVAVQLSIDVLDPSAHLHMRRPLSGRGGGVDRTVLLDARVVRPGAAVAILGAVAADDGADRPTERDADALERDATAAARDQRASQRDERARVREAHLRPEDAAAGRADRTAAHADRTESRIDREHAARDRDWAAIDRADPHAPVRLRFIGGPWDGFGWYAEADQAPDRLDVGSCTYRADHRQMDGQRGITTVIYVCSPPEQ